MSGVLVEGRWVERGYETRKTGGAFIRDASTFRDHVTMDGSSGFKAAPGRSPAPGRTARSSSAS